VDKMHKKYHRPVGNIKKKITNKKYKSAQKKKIFKKVYLQIRNAYCMSNKNMLDKKQL
jgi:hypothetical protein